MTDEELITTANSGRLINLAEQEIYPLLDKKIHERMQMMTGKFRVGETNFQGDVAYLCALNDLKNNLLNLQTKAKQAFQKLEEKTREQQ